MRHKVARVSSRGVWLSWLELYVDEGKPEPLFPVPSAPNLLLLRPAVWPRQSTKQIHVLHGLISEIIPLVPVHTPPVKGRQSGGTTDGMTPFVPRWCGVGCRIITRLQQLVPPVSSQQPERASPAEMDQHDDSDATAFKGEGGRHQTLNKKVTAALSWNQVFSLLAYQVIINSVLAIIN